ncbi:MAG TPA: hypothetical protein VGM80_02540 [Gaiellaceae bacterium]|jgi:hypothetical protein
MTAAVIVAIVCAVGSAAAVGVAASLLTRARNRMRTLEEEIERGRAHFDETIANEAQLRATELAEMMALARSHALSMLAEEERRIVEERRRDVAERERDATTKLATALAAAQRSVEQRFAQWGTDVTGLQQGLTSELEKIGQRQQQMIAAADTKITAESERLESAFEEQRMRIARVRDELERATSEVASAVAADLETHSAERRRALQEVAERLRKRDRELQEQIEREQSEATQRIAGQLQDVERRQIEGVRRAVARDAQHAAEAAATSFDNAIKVAREEAARRLHRELELAVERFARDAEGVLAERVESGLRALEAKLHELERRLDALSAHA